MASRNIPPKVIERRSDERDTFRLLNALRKQVADLVAAAGGGTVFSMRWGSPTSSLYTSKSGTEQVVDQVELPKALTAFTVLHGGQLLSNGGSGIVTLRLGGGDRTLDGTIISALTRAAATYARETDTKDVTNATAATRIKLCMQSAAVNQQLNFKDGYLVIQAIA